MKKLYLILAGLGIILPYWAMFSSIIIDNYSFIEFFQAWFDNNAVRMMAADLGVSAITFSIVIINRYKKGAGPNPAKYFLMMFGVGLSFAFPMYMLNVYKN